MVAGDEEGRPIAGIGAVPLHPGVYGVWMVASDEWPKVAAAVTRWALGPLTRHLVAAGAHRVEARSMHGHAVAHRFLERCGARHECALPSYGRDRETLHLFAWTR